MFPLPPFCRIKRLPLRARKSLGNFFHCLHTSVHIYRDGYISSNNKKKEPLCVCINLWKAREGMREGFFFVQVAIEVRPSVKGAHTTSFTTQKSREISFFSLYSAPKNTFPSSIESRRNIKTRDCRVTGRSLRKPVNKPPEGMCHHSG